VKRRKRLLFTFQNTKEDKVELYKGMGFISVRGDWKEGGLGDLDAA